jgi:MipA family protein
LGKPPGSVILAAFHAVNIRMQIRSGSGIALIVALGLVLPAAARAQSSSDDYALLGAGVRSRPAYDGSASQHAELIPVVRYYGRPFFARTTQGMLEGGARMELAPGLAFGVQLAYEAGRRASESAFLRDHGVEDLKTGASLGFHLEWDGKLGRSPVNLLLRTRQNADTDRSDQIDFRGTAGIYGSGRVSAGVFAQTTWATAKGTNTLYGITQDQSAATGLPAFQAGSGFLFASLGILGSVDVSRDWVAVWSLEGRRLQGDARRSPLAERTSNYYVSLGLAYRF